MPAGGIAQVDGDGHAYMDLCPQKILANRRAGGCARFSRREFNSEQCAASVALPTKKNSLATLTPLCACHTIRSCSRQDRGHKRKSRRPVASFLRETRAQSKHRVPALPFPVG